MTSPSWCRILIIRRPRTISSTPFALPSRFTLFLGRWTNNPEEALTSNQARGVLIIPPNFGRDIARGVNAPVQLLVDGSDSNTAAADFGRRASRLRRPTTSARQARRIRSRCKHRIRLVVQPRPIVKKILWTGNFCAGLSMFPPLLASLAMAKEGEQKTILQVYVSSISAHEFLLGKIFAFMVVALGECLLMLVLLFTYFGLSLAGDPTPFLVATVLYAFCVASFGTMVGAAIPSQAAAMQAVALGGFLLVFLLSGLIYPDQQHSRRAALALQPDLGPLLHRDRARRAAAGRRMAGDLVQGARNRGHRSDFLRAGMAHHAAHAGEGISHDESSRNDSSITAFAR